MINKLGHILDSVNLTVITTLALGNVNPVSSCYFGAVGNVKMRFFLNWRFTKTSEEYTVHAVGVLGLMNKNGAFARSTK